MAKTTAKAALAWKQDGAAWLAFQGNRLRASVRERQGEWHLALPEPSGLFAFVRSFASLADARRHVERIH